MSKTLALEVDWKAGAVDLEEYYLQNVNRNEYHYRFYDLVKRVNTTCNIYDGESISLDYRSEVFLMKMRSWINLACFASRGQNPMPRKANAGSIWCRIFECARICY